MNKITLFVITSIFFIGCTKQQQIEGYVRDANGFYYQLLGIGDGNENPEIGNVVVFDAVMKTQSDSVFWDTKHDAANGFYVALNSKFLEGSCNNYFLKMVEGDSVSLLVKPAVFFRNYLEQTPLSHFF